MRELTGISSSFLFPIVTGIVSGFVIWLLTYRSQYANLEFIGLIYEPVDFFDSNSKKVFRIQIHNRGRADLMDLCFSGRIRVPAGDAHPDKVYKIPMDHTYPSVLVKKAAKEKEDRAATVENTCVKL